MEAKIESVVSTLRMLRPFLTKQWADKVSLCMQALEEVIAELKESKENS